MSRHAICSVSVFVLILKYYEQTCNLFDISVRPCLEVLWADMQSVRYQCSSLSWSIMSRHAICLVLVFFLVLKYYEHTCNLFGISVRPCLEVLWADMQSVRYQCSSLSWSITNRHAICSVSVFVIVLKYYEQTCNLFGISVRPYLEVLWADMQSVRYQCSSLSWSSIMSRHAICSVSVFVLILKYYEQTCNLFGISVRPCLEVLWADRQSVRYQCSSLSWSIMSRHAICSVSVFVLALKYYEQTCNLFGISVRPCLEVLWADMQSVRYQCSSLPWSIMSRHAICSVSVFVLALKYYELTCNLFGISVRPCLEVLWTDMQSVRYQCSSLPWSIMSWHAICSVSVFVLALKYYEQTCNLFGISVRPCLEVLWADMQSVRYQCSSLSWSIMSRHAICSVSVFVLALKYYEQTCNLFGISVRPCLEVLWTDMQSVQYQCSSLSWSIMSWHAICSVSVFVLALKYYEQTCNLFGISVRPCLEVLWADMQSVRYQCSSLPWSIMNRHAICSVSVFVLVLKYYEQTCNLFGISVRPCLEVLWADMQSVRYQCSSLPWSIMNRHAICSVSVFVLALKYYELTCNLFGISVRPCLEVLWTDMQSVRYQCSSLPWSIMSRHAICSVSVFVLALKYYEQTCNLFGISVRPCLEVLWADMQSVRYQCSSLPWSIMNRHAICSVSVFVLALKYYELTCNLFGISVRPCLEVLWTDMQSVRYQCSSLPWSIMSRHAICSVSVFVLALKYYEQTCNLFGISVRPCLAANTCLPFPESTGKFR